jgi:hypothetical protein
VQRKRVALTIFIVLAVLAPMGAHADPQNVRESFAVLQPFQPPGGGETAPSPGSSKRDPERDLEFRALDLDGDGFVSRAEAAGQSEVMDGFDRADRDNDGRLSYREYDALVKRAAALKKAREAREKRQARAKK